jgi:hypothetical protein
MSFRLSYSMARNKVHNRRTSSKYVEPSQYSGVQKQRQKIIRTLKFLYIAPHPVTPIRPGFMHPCFVALYYSVAYPGIIFHGGGGSTN